MSSHLIKNLKFYASQRYSSTFDWSFLFEEIQSYLNFPSSYTLNQKKFFVTMLVNCIYEQQQGNLFEFIEFIHSSWAKNKILRSFTGYSDEYFIPLADLSSIEKCFKRLTEDQKNNVISNFHDMLANPARHRTTAYSYTYLSPTTFISTKPRDLIRPLFKKGFKQI